MAEPVGLISLGIEVCLLLTKYVGDAKKLDVETTQAIQHFREVEQTLRSLENILNSDGFDDLAYAGVVRSAITSCKDAIEKLKAEIEKCLGNADQEQPHGFAAIKQMSKFPWKKSDLSSWRAQLTTLQRSLQMAVQTFKLEQTRHMLANQATIMLQQETHRTMLSDLISQPDRRRRLESGAAERIEAGPAARMPDIEEDDEEVEEIPRIPVRSRRERGCTCRGDRLSRIWRIWGGLQVTAEWTSMHEPACPSFLVTSRKSRYTMALTPYQRSSIVGVSMTLQFLRVASASIPSATLLCRRLVPEHYGIFSVLRYRIRPSGKKDSSVSEIRSVIDAMLRSGEASVMDVTTSGETVLEAATLWVVRDYRLGSDETFGQGLALLHDMTDAGANINEQITGQETVLQRFTQYSFHAASKSRILRLTIELLALKAESNTMMPGWHRSLVHRMCEGSAELRNHFELPPLVDAIHAKSTRGLRDQLAHNPRSCDETLPGQETVLHVVVSIGWHEGLSILVPHCTRQLRVCDRSGRTPIDLAILERHTDCVAILLRAESPIPSLSGFLRLATALTEHDDFFSTHLADHRMTRDYLDEFTRRRNQLCHLAMTRLSTDLRQTLELSQQVVLDSKAILVLHQLQTMAIPLPPYLEGQHPNELVPVYLTSGETQASARLMQTLWDRGFHDVLYSSSSGVAKTVSPLETLFSQDSQYNCFNDPIGYVCSQSHVAMWLMEHGGLQSNPSDQGDKILLALSAKSGRIMQSPAVHFKSEFRNHGSQKLLSKLFYPVPRDQCECAFSVNGCTGLTAYMREIVGSRLTHRSVRAIVRVDQCAELFDANGHALIRAAIFQSLELQHTCCFLEPWSPCQVSTEDFHGLAPGSDPPRLLTRTPDEIVQIDHSQHERIEILEALVPEMNEAWKKSGTSIIDFLAGPYENLVHEAYADLLNARSQSSSDDGDEKPLHGDRTAGNDQHGSQDEAGGT